MTTSRKSVDTPAVPKTATQEILHGDIWKLRKGERRVMIMEVFPDSVVVASMTDRQSTIDRKRFLALFVKDLTTTVEQPALGT